MPNIDFILPDGSHKVVAAEPDETMMMAATRNKVSGVIGECGGHLTCATCHVFVDPAWADRVQPKSEEEEEMLENTTEEPTQYSRLSCQIVMTDALDGIVVEVAATQRIGG